MLEHLRWLDDRLLWSAMCMVQDECDAQGVNVDFLASFVVLFWFVSVFIDFFSSYTLALIESELQLDRSAFGWEGRLRAYHPVCKAVLVLWEYKVGYFYKKKTCLISYFPKLWSLWKTWRNVTTRAARIWRVIAKWRLFLNLWKLTFSLAGDKYIYLF